MNEEEEEEEEEEEDEFEPAFVDPEAPDTYVHLDLNEDDERPMNDEDEDEEDELMDAEQEMMMTMNDEDRDAADERVIVALREDAEVVIKQHGDHKSVFCVGYGETNGGANASCVVASGGADDRAYFTNVQFKGRDEDEDHCARFEGKGLERVGNDSVSACVFSRHGRSNSNSPASSSASPSLLATGSLDGTISVFDGRTGEFLRALEGPESGVEWLQWHPHGPVLLAGCEDFCAWMWNASDGNLMQVFAGHSGSVSCGQFSKDGKVVFTGSFDGSFRAWNPRSGATIASFHKGGLFHDAPVTCMDSKSEGREGSYLVLTGSEDCTLKLSTVNANDGDSSKILGNFLAHDKCIECVEFCDGIVGNYAASGSVDATIRIWDLPSQKVRSVLSHGKAVSQLKWVPNSAMLYRCVRFVSLFIVFMIVCFVFFLIFLQQKGPSRRVD
jgi:angio-associated migratory cell protein